MRAGWVFAAVVACAACGGKDDKPKDDPPTAAAAIDPTAVKRFADDFGHPLVGVGPEAPADKIVAALGAALAEAPAVGFVMLEAPPGGGPVAGKGEAGHKGYRKICALKPAPPAPPRDSIESAPPTLSVLLTHDQVWLSVSRIKDTYRFEARPGLKDDLRPTAVQLSKEEWFSDDRYAELALESGVSGATVIAVIEAMCPEWAAYRIVAPEALTSRPEL